MHSIKQLAQDIPPNDIDLALKGYMDNQTITLITFFGTLGKISVPNRTLNTEFKYVSSFSQSPAVFCDSQVKCEKMCIFTYFTGQQSLTFFWHTGENICS
jgi:hypothetical protein